jgi:hypothetical protein
MRRPENANPGAVGCAGVEEASQIHERRAAYVAAFEEARALPTGGLFEPAENRIDFAAFLKTARIGDAYQAIFGPVECSRHGRIAPRDLLAVERLNSRGDLTLIRGFDEVLALIPARVLIEEGGQ